MGSSFKNRNASQNSISVVGLGTTDFTSDEIYWSGTFRIKGNDAKTAYSLINQERQKVLNFFKRKGFTENEIHLHGITISKHYRTITLEPTDDGHYTRTEQIPDGFEASQTVYFSSKKNKPLMQKIEKVSSQAAELVNLGVEFDGNTIQYTYSELANLKHDLIQKASKDARERALKIVRSAKGHLGQLQNASMGVFQITGKGEVVEDSYGGNYDVYSKNKTARITVRLNYNLN